MNTNNRMKRSRSLSSSSTEGSSSSFRSPSPPPKYHRAPSSPTTKPFLCVLPPTCSQTGSSTSYSNQVELDRHQDIYHKWICRIPIRDRAIEVSHIAKGKEKETLDLDSDLDLSKTVTVPESFSGGRIKDGKRWKECLKAFPDERLYNLHQAEVHDPIIRAKKENGQKTFQCFLPPTQCGKVFLDPKKRRRHLIDKHKYPPEYFFSITNHGINKLVSEDGLAMSLIRPRRDPVSSRGNSTPLEPETPLPADIHRLDKGSDPSSNPRADIDMDDIISRMGQMESSLAFVPRGVRKATKTKEKEMIVEVESVTK
ncbi:uncharacterized protein IL334_000350 [Kwoniella shivajii]|uniref:C2H2-type domain-containing protein n=1 Tax=Kwoniella shivajii TaxID=564305 RepID=A0ABZ1CNX5_9TREE|nr:hypothetical protein IL334_000350 [Kwoniella shivajii]